MSFFLLYQKNPCVYLAVCALGICFSLRIYAQETFYTEEEAEKMLKSARYLYEYGDFPSAIKKLTVLLYPLKLRDEEHIVEARKILGVCYYLTGEKKLAKREFRKLLFLKPDYTLDPFLIPPKIVELFDRIKSEIKKKLKDIYEDNNENNIPPKKELQTKVEPRYIKKNLFLINFLPFGAGQFQNRQKTKGFLFLASELVALGVNMTSYSLIETKRDPATRAFVGNNYKEAKQLQKVQFISIGVFGILYIWNVVDAILNFKSEIELKKVQ